MNRRRFLSAAASAAAGLQWPRLWAALASGPRQMAMVGSATREWIGAKPFPGSFALVSNRAVAPLYVDPDDYETVHLASDDLAHDLSRVAGTAPRRLSTLLGTEGIVVIVGSLERSQVLQELARRGLIDGAGWAGRWEAYSISVVENPLPGITAALVLAGGDRRGTAYAVYELARQIGVSPWEWWADVPVRPRPEIHVSPEGVRSPGPTVRYRGIYINDEYWGLRPWATQTYAPEEGDRIGPKTYRRVFQLLLRLKANLLWPASSSAFNADLENAREADRYGIVMGSPHNHPMLINVGKQWDPAKQGPWDYHANARRVRQAWEESVSAVAAFENVYTVGMRGSGDLPMTSQLDPHATVRLFDTILYHQREVLASVVGRAPEAIPQAFVLYKEMLEMYDRGIHVPDDVTLVWPDDNYGYLQQLDSSRERGRKGGSGIYYHLSHLGRPHEYLWLCTTPPALIWEELTKACAFGADRLWVFNVGDIKPAEYAMQYCFDLAWAVPKFGNGSWREHLRQWLHDGFGPDLAAELAAIMEEYYRLSFVRKPELMGFNRLEPRTPVQDTDFSFVNYREAEGRLCAAEALRRRTEKLGERVPSDAFAAFFELIYYPVVGAALMNEKALHAQQNHRFARRGWIEANREADLALAAHERMKAETQRYNELLEGKWRGMMSTGGFGNDGVYAPPEVVRVNAARGWDVDPEGWEPSPDGDEPARLPVFEAGYHHPRRIALRRRGGGPLEWKVRADRDWIRCALEESNSSGPAAVTVTIDWTRFRASGHERGAVTIEAAGVAREVAVYACRRSAVPRGCHAETDRVVAIDAARFQRSRPSEGAAWEVITGLGYAGAVVAPLPLETAPLFPNDPYGDFRRGPTLEYDFETVSTGAFNIISSVVPTHPINADRGARIAISVDDEPPRIIDFATHGRTEAWLENVARNAARAMTEHWIHQPGRHLLRLWMVDTGMLVDRFILDFGGLRQSYGGPPSTWTAGSPPSP